jgi:thiol-disulfide isomerase/thioredoxin
MSTEPTREQPAVCCGKAMTVGLGIVAVAGICLGLGLMIASYLPRSEAMARPLAERADDVPVQRERVEAPELEGGTDWINTNEPIKLKDLKGKIVVLDFWTLCCINCIHTLPDLAKLEKKYPKELVVIGVHSAKFENEKNTASIRKAIMRYEVTHPVVNDAQMKIWESYNVNSWPTLIVIDAEGKILGRASGEGNYDDVDAAVTRLIKEAKEKKILNEKPLAFQLAREAKSTPLYFPGKILADAAGKRLFISDSTHHRIVVTDLDGKLITTIGTGKAGDTNGKLDEASFNDPQGLALKGDTLYVADRKNHLIRSIDLKYKNVNTVAGTGKQGSDRQTGGKARETGLNSPWDLCFAGDSLYIAMAGHHQIWKLDLQKEELEPYAGNGSENIGDGTLANARFAQPSGLTSDGKTLYVADSEVSAVRAVPLGGSGRVKTIVGLGLFKFGDVDGEADEVRLQHALGLAYVDGLLYVADTYNSKIKVIDPGKRTSATFLGGKDENGPLFNEPAGISYADGKLYVADTNAHRIRVVDLKSKAVRTLALEGLEAPKTK